MNSIASRLATAFGLCLGLALAAPAAFAQPTTNPNPYDPLVRQLKQAQTRLGPQMKYVSGAMRNAFALAQHWEGLKAGVAQTANVRAAMRPSAKAAAATAVTTTSLASRVLGFTQSETSTAWCGTNAVVGFNDTGSILETINNTLLGDGLSSVGYGQSTNANATNPVFADKGALPAAHGAGLPSPTGGFLIGDPVAACTSASNFYLSNVGLTCQFFLFGGGLVCGATSSTVSVSTSSDGGATFAPAVNVVAKDVAAHLLDKDWMAIDTTNHEFYVSYTDFDTSHAGPNCKGLLDTRIAIEIVSSADGVNWGKPVTVAEVCANALDASASAAVQGSQIAIGTDGSVYVAWEATDLNGAGPTVHEIDLAKGNIGASSFVSLPKITNVNCAGDCIDGILQGSIRIAELPSLVAGKGTQVGKLFMAWNDGDNPQVDTGVGTYNLTDVKLMSSSDGGMTWSPPVKVNNTNSLTDHFQPAAASDHSGRVAVCFYDRRNDANNFYIDRYCANSTNGGASFAANTRETSKSFLSTVNQDLLLNAGGVGNYMGDYDTLASDTMNSTNGFRGGSASNLTGAPNVQENKF